MYLNIYGKLSCDITKFKGTGKSCQVLTNHVYVYDVYVTYSKS